MARPAFKGFLAHAHEGKDVLTSDANDGDTMPCTCVPGLLHQTQMAQTAGDPRMRTQGVHAPALEPGSSALQVAKRITGMGLTQVILNVIHFCLLHHSSPVLPAYKRNHGSQYAQSVTDFNSLCKPNDDDIGK